MTSRETKTHRSSPFAIENIGRAFVRIAHAGRHGRLLKAEILSEEATIFIHLSFQKQWPYSIRNESTIDISFYQGVSNFLATQS